MKRCSKSYVIKEMQIKTMRYHYIPIRMAQTLNTKCWCGCGETLLVGTQNGTATMKDSLAVYCKTKHTLTMLLLLLLSRFSRVWLCDPRNGSPPGSPVPGILQARTLEWVAISFSNAWKWKVKVKLLSRVQLFTISWTEPTRLLRPWDFPGKSTGVGCHCLLCALTIWYSNYTPLY